MNKLTKYDEDSFSCEFCKGTGWMKAFDGESKCNHHTYHASIWLRYKSGRPAWVKDCLTGEYVQELPADWQFEMWGENPPLKIKIVDEICFDLGEG
jgi:hypothetical protein